MAIVQASLQEDVLTRQERSVIRGIYRASQLAEALVILGKADATVETISHDATCGSVKYSNSASAELKVYLANAIMIALANTKVPVQSGKITTSSMKKKSELEP